MKTINYSNADRVNNPHGVDARKLYGNEHVQAVHILLKAGESLKKHSTEVDVFFYVLEGDEGKVMVRFTVEKTGKINDVKVVKSLDYYLDKEAIRAINTLPNWIPGTQCNQKVNIIVTMPVNFTLDVPATEKAAWKPNEKTVVMLDGVRLPSVFDLEWLSYANLTSYKVLEPKTKEVIKQLTKEYGKDAVNGVVLIRTKDENETK